MAKFVVDLKIADETDKQTMDIIEHALNFFSGIVKVEEYSEDLPLDRLLGQLNNKIRKEEGVDLIKNFCEATLEYYKNREK